MQKSLIKDNTKKDIPLILCIIYFSYLIFKIFIQKEITGTDNSILKTMYFFRMDKLLFCVPILYYFIKTNKEKKYFKVNKKLNITDSVTYFALIYGINIFLNLILSAINIEGQKFIVQRPIYTDIIYAICIAPVLEEIVFVLKGPKEIFPLLGIIFISLFVLCLIFFIIGLKRKNYQDVFLAFKLNNEDRKNMVIFLKNNILYILIIFVIVIISLLFNYKLF